MYYIKKITIKREREGQPFKRWVFLVDHVAHNIEKYRTAQNKRFNSTTTGLTYEER